jgi:hypothetical protein
MADPLKNNAEEVTKLLGAQVPIKIFWEFKKAAADRKESMTEAILNAGMLYIEFKPDKEIALFGKLSCIEEEEWYTDSGICSNCKEKVMSGKYCSNCGIALKEENSNE